MSETKMVTEYNAVVREREAFVQGSVAACGQGRYTEDVARIRAVDRYPLPKTTQPRVVIVGVREWKYESGRFWERGRTTHMETFSWNLLTLPSGLDEKLVRQVADLLANPTVEVEAE